MDLQQPIVEVIAAQQATDEAEAKPWIVRAAPWLVWSMWALSVTLVIITLILAYQNDPADFEANLLSAILHAIALFLYATVGALIVSRHADNPIGWIFGMAALLVVLGVFAEEYAQYTLITVPGSLPGGILMAWLTAWPRNIGFFLMFTFLMLLFPNGRLLSRRWRMVAWLAGSVIVLGAVLNAFKPGPLGFVPGVNNPLGMENAAGVFELYEIIWGPVALVAITLCLTSVIVRFRRAGGHERQQLKWFAYAAALGIVQFAVSLALAFVPTALTPDALDVLLALSILAFPIAAGIAILRYRLYDIDLLINRTLVYVPLTAILAGLYSASIALFQKLFVSITREQSDAAIVITTLILASSFTPIKNGLQGVVDKRFKEVPDPIKKLRSFGEQVRSFVQLNSADQLLQRLLDEVVSAFDAVGGAVYKGEGEQMRVAHATEGWDGDTEMSAPLTGDGRRIGMVSLGARRNGLDYTERDRQTLQDIVDVVGQAIVLAEQETK
jgi:GAF domain-containing protein